MGLLSSSEKFGGSWFVVAFDGIDGWGYTLSNCLKDLVMTPAIAPISKGFLDSC